jgi:hypothetical protein
MSRVKPGHAPKTQPVFVHAHRLEALDVQGRQRLHRKFQVLTSGLELNLTARLSNWTFVHTFARSRPFRVGRGVWDIHLMANGQRGCEPLGEMQTAFYRVVRARWISWASSERLFYRVFLPLGIVANLGLGIWILAGLNPHMWTDWLKVGTGVFCCLVAGWLAASAWSKSYWSRAMVRQVALWRRIADTFFAWLEEAPLPPEAIHRLKTSLDEAVPKGEHL